MMAPKAATLAAGGVADVPPLNEVVPPIRMSSPLEPATVASPISASIPAPPINKSLPGDSPQITTALIAALDDPVIYIRKEMAGFLGERKAAAALPTLRAHLRSDLCGSVRAVCAWAIYQITGDVDESLPVMLELDLYGEQQ